MRIKILLCLLIIPILSGCSGVSIGSEPEEVAVISAIGFDNNGKNITITAQILGIENKDSKLVTAVGDTAKQAMDSLNKTISGRLYLAHCAVAVLAENLTAEQTDDVFNFLLLQSEFPPAGAVAVCKNAASLLNAKSSSNMPIGYDLLNILVIKSENFRLYQVINSKEFPHFSVENENYRLKENLWINLNLFPPI